MTPDFLNKEIVTTYIVDNRKMRYNKSDLPLSSVDTGHMVTQLRSLGRKYYKSGKFCIQTMAGVVYKTNDKETRRHLYILQCGVARQSPVDTKHDSDTAVEAAIKNAVVSPVISIMLDHLPEFYEFNDYAMPYLYNAKQQYVNTKAENMAR